MSGDGGVVRACRCGFGCGFGFEAHAVLEDQCEFGGGEQAFEALFVGERGGPMRGGGRRRRGGVHGAAVVGSDQRERRDAVRATAVEQGAQIHGLITSLE
jgi:hypothetical protein